MSIRLRKSFGKGPFRVTVSKSGVGCSVGTKGARHTITADGRTRDTLSIPGTGLGYVSEGGSRKNKKNSSTNYITTTYKKKSSFLSKCLKVFAYPILGLSALLCIGVPVVGIIGLVLGFLILLLAKMV